MTVALSTKQQYASVINNKMTLISVADEAKNINSVKIISDNLSTLTKLSSKIVSIIQNQIALTDFEYREKARIQREVNAETREARIKALNGIAGNSGDMSPLTNIFGAMFGSLTESLQALADSTATSCGTGSGLGSGSSGSSILKTIATGALAIGGLAAGAFGLDAAYDYFTDDNEDIDVGEESKQLAPTPDTATPAGVSNAKPQAEIVKSESGGEYVKDQGSTTGYKITRNKDGSSSIDFSNKVDTSSMTVSQPAVSSSNNPPSIPTSKGTPAPSMSKTKASPGSAQAGQARSSFNWPSLFTSFQMGGVSGAATYVTNGFGQGIREGFGTGYEQGLEGVKPAGSSENAGKAMQFFMSPRQGWTKEQAAGIVGNLQQESTAKLDPNSRNEIGMYGLAQWNQARRRDFERVYKKSIYGTSFEEQLNFIQWELTNSEKAAGNRLKKAKTVEEAAIAMSYYERYDGHELGANSPDTRKRIANAIALAGQDSFAMKLGRNTGSIFGNIGAYISDTWSMLKGAGKFIYPVSSVRVTSGFGPRNVKGGSKNHKGIDFGASRRGVDGDPVHATSAGTVTFAGSSGGYGNLIIINHGDGVESRYGHLRSFTTISGKKVKQGEQIGVMGNTGHSTGTHLHFEIRRNGQAVNPAPLLGKAISVKPDDTATEPGNEPQNKPGSKVVPGKPGWALTPSKADDPRVIQQSQIERFNRERRAKGTIIVQQPNTGSTMMFNVSGGSGKQSTAGVSQDVSKDYKRAFGL